MTDGSPGWFRDPSDPSLARWHDGDRWTEHTLVIADQTPGVEPPPPDVGEDTVATPIVAAGSAAAAAEPEFHIPRPARGIGRAGGGSWPAWAKFGAPIAVIVLALGAWVVTSGGDDDPDSAETTDTIPASLDEAVEAARQAGLPDELTDSQAAAFIERICAATTRPAAVEQLGEDIGERLARIPDMTVSSVRQSVGALGVGAALRCRDDLESAPELIDDLKDLAVLAFQATATAVTVLPTDEGTDAGITDGGADDGTDGGTTTGTNRTTRTTRRSGGSTATTRAPTTTTTRPLPQVLPNTSCSSEGAKAVNKVTGGSLTCQKKCNGSGLQWRSSPCPTVPTTPTTAPGSPPPSIPTTTTTAGGGTTGGPTTGGT
ncbi:MAG TPA: DUF2510 domain-containing protein [Acidimicrobiales bacterium]|nr:DUF2510 domain-containing protein [Acidimicrobiales bacterium]